MLNRIGLLLLILNLCMSAFSTVFYVSKDGDDAANYGRRWNDAFITINRALERAEAGDEIWVASGRYFEDRTIEIPSEISVYGAFSGREKALEERDLARNQTILDGGKNHSCAINMGRLDGFTIQNGYGYVGGVENEGTLINCILFKNTGSYYGGVKNSEMIKNCVVYHNISCNGQGGGIYNSGRVYNCTVVGNSDSAYYYSSAGVYNADGYVYNSIVWGNQGGDIYCSYGSEEHVYYCCFSPDDDDSGSYNIHEDPQFVKADGVSESLNLRLLPDSPCIDYSGTVSELPVDCEGISRPYGVKVDLGAYEWDGHNRVLFYCAKQFCQPGESIHFYDQSIGDDLSYEWDFEGDQKIDSIQSNPEWVYPDPGKYTVTLTITDHFGDKQTLVKEACISVGERLYVCQNGNDVHSGKSWNDAFQTINRALKLACKGDSIWVAQGDYIENQTLMIPVGISLYGGFSGIESDMQQRNLSAHKTYINGEFNWQCLSNSGVLDGLNVIHSGFANKQNNAGITNMGEMVNCTISESQGFYAGGVYNFGLMNQCYIDNNQGLYSGGIHNIYGSVINCQIIGNTSLYASGGVDNDYGYVADCKIIRNTGSSSGGIENFFGTVVNLLISGNSAESVGGLINIGMASFCTVVNNKVTSEYGTFCGIQNSRQLYNSIAWGNSGTDLVCYDNDLCIADHCCYQTGSNVLSGENNIQNDPLFLAEDGPEAYQDFHLVKPSPCINAGSDFAALNHDLDQHDRPLYGGYDIGAYEYMKDISVDFYADQYNGQPGLTVQFSDATRGMTSESWKWDLNGDGITDSTAKNPVYTYLESGYYSVSLTISCGGESHTITRDKYIYIGECIFVSKSGDDLNNGHDWDQAFLTISHAISMASKADSIWIAHGSWQVNEPLLIPENIFVYGGFEGNETALSERTFDGFETVIDGQNEYRCIKNQGYLNDLTVINGKAYSGGGLLNISGTVENCTFYSNFAEYNGGAIKSIGGLISQCNVHNNEADYRGGGIYANDTLIENCNFFENSSSDGGACYLSSANIFDCEIQNNTASSEGGGIYSINSAIKECRVASNSTQRYAAGIYNELGSIQSCVIESNMGLSGYASRIGIYNKAGSISKCVIQNNMGDYAVALDSEQGTVSNCIIRNNQASYTSGYGGIISIDEGLMENCLITRNNSCTSTVYCDQATMINCTVTDNSAMKTGAVRVSNSNIINSILWGNDISDIDCDGGSVSNSCYQTGLDVIGDYNIQSDPLFVFSNEGVFDAHLKANSPCIDSGTFIDAPQYDLDGISRPQIQAVDMGAYEWNDQLKALFSCDKVNCLVGNTVQFRDSSYGSPVRWEWDMDGDQRVDSTEQNPDFTYHSPGYYSVTLTVYDEVSQNTITKINEIYVSSRYYVATNGSDTNKGTGWSNAFESISYALSKATLFDHIWVAEGTYQEGNTLTVPVGISLFGGFSGNEYALAERKFSSNPSVISGNNEYRCIDNWGIVDGFDIIEGYHDKGAGIYNHSGTINYCNVYGNSYCADSDNNNGYGAGVYNDDGSLMYCQIYNNRIYDCSKACGAGIYNVYGQVIDCDIYKNTLLSSGGEEIYLQGAGICNSGGTILNSRILLNKILSVSGKMYGGGIYNGGTIDHCMISSNCTMPSDNRLDYTDSKGGGIYHDWGTVSSCKIFNNQAEYGGGAFSEGNIENCLFYLNYAFKAGAVYLDYYDTKLTHCTVFGNSASSVCGGVFSNYGRIFNCILTGNENQDVYTYDHYGSSMSSSCYGEGVTDEEISSNINEMPLFVDQDALNFHLLPNSPCIDSGNIEYSVTSDLDGTIRPQGSEVDMGAYEWSDRFIADFTPGKSEYHMDEMVLFHDISSGLADAWEWDFNEDGEIDSTDQNPTWIYDQPGLYSVSLTVRKGDSSLCVCKKSCVYIGKKIYVSTKGNDKNSGSSWEYAFLSIDHALNNAYGGDEIWISRGHYFLQNKQKVSRNISLIGGFSGTETHLIERVLDELQTIIDGQQNVSFFDNAGRIDGFTFMNGNGNPGAIYNEGQVTHCRFIQNYSEKCAGALINASSGRVMNSLFLENESAENAGAVFNKGDLVNCTFVNNKIQDPSAWFGAVYNIDGIVKNSVFSMNDKFDINADNSKTGTVQNSCFIKSNNILAVDCIHEDPMFVHVPLSSETWDLHLSSNSPCIDQGIEIVGLMDDLDGISRTLNTVDMGCYERSEALKAGFYTSSSTVHFGQEVRFSDTSIGSPERWEWDFDNDGMIDSTNQNPSFVFPRSGYHSISLTVYKGNDSDIVVKNSSIYVGKQYFVSKNGNDAHDGLSWNTALDSISCALKKAVSFDDIFVSQGIWVEGSTITIPENIHLVGGFNDMAPNQRNLKKFPAIIHGENEYPCIVNEGLVEGFSFIEGMSNETEYAGGITNSGILRYCEVYENSGCGSPGGILNHGEVSNCEVKQNHSDFKGGGIFNSEAGVVTNALVIGNKADNGGGIFNCGDVYLSTVSGNSSLYDRSVGAGISNNGGNILNSISAGNEAKDIFCSPDQPGEISYSCYEYSLNLTGVNNMQATPAFLNTDGDSLTWNLHLMKDSPCIDAGRFMGGLVNDLDGVQRPEGVSIDMGCYEYRNQLLADFYMDNTIGRVSQIIRFYDCSYGNPDSWAWDFNNDGIIDSMDQNPSFEFSGGSYSISLTVTKDGETHTCVKEHCIYIGKRYYVTVDGNDTSDGKSWANAFQTVSTALDAAVDSDEIWIAHGEFQEGVVMTVPENITLFGGFSGIEQSLEERSIERYKTVIDGELQHQVFINHGILDGLHVLNGLSSSPGAGINNTGIVRNCFISCCKNSSCTSGAGGGIYNSGLMVNSILLNNYAFSGGGIFNSSNGQVMNTSLFKNKGNSGGGIFNEGLVVNSIIWGSVGSDLYSSQSGSILYSVYETGPMSSDSENIHSDPLFVNTHDNDVLNWNLHLQAGSPALDHGANEYGPESDLCGISRPQNNQVDIGAFEQKESFEIACYAKNRFCKTGASISFFTSSNFTPDSYEWDLNGDGLTDSYAACPSFEYSEKGYYSISLKTFCNGQAIHVNLEDYIYVYNIIHVSPHGNDSSSGLSWDTSVHTLEKAISLALPHDQIWVKSSTYSTHTLIIPSDIEVFGGFSGNESSLEQRTDDFSILDGGRRLHCVENYGVLNGFIIQNGYSETSGGGVINYGLIENCKVCNNFSEVNGGGIYNMDSGIIKNTKVYSNVSDSKGGGLYNQYGHLISCEVTGNTSNAGIAGGIYNQAGSLFGCLIRDNVAESPGRIAKAGGVYNEKGLISECEISHNQTDFEYPYSYDGFQAYGAGIYDNGGIIEKSEVCLNQNNLYLYESESVYSYGVGLCLNESYLENSLVYNNSTHESYDSYYNDLGDAKSVTFGAGISMTDSRVINCNVIRNGGSVSYYDLILGGGISQAGGSLMNTIAWNNSVTDICSDRLSLVFNNCYEEGYVPEERDSVMLDPSFVYGKSYEKNDFGFHLMPGSPCIDAGFKIDSIHDDYIGIQRPQGDRFDIGAYEFIPFSEAQDPIICEISPSDNIVIPYISSTEIFYIFDQDLDGQIIGIEYSLNGAPFTSCLNATSYIQRIGPFRVGENIVRFRVKDNDGNYSDIVERRVFRKTKLVADFCSDQYYGKAPLRVQFFDCSLGSPETFSWDLNGNGYADSYQKNPSYIYNKAGKYTVKLTVYNGEDSSTKENEYTIYVLPSDTPDLQAYYIEPDFPFEIDSHTHYSVTVQFRNMGPEPWFAGDVIKLGAVGDKDPLSGSLRYELTEDVYYGEIAEFTINLYALKDGSFISKWRMIKEGECWFGETLELQIEVRTQTAVSNMNWTVFE